jgi:murein DD-endopeptidase MepM/ murein hydrolase activator NlpD
MRDEIKYNKKRDILPFKVIDEYRKQIVNEVFKLDKKFEICSVLGENKNLKKIKQRGEVIFIPLSDYFFEDNLNMIDNPNGLEEIVNRKRGKNPHFTLSEYNGRREKMIKPYEIGGYCEYKVGGQYYHPGIDVGLKIKTRLYVPLDGQIVNIVIDDDVGGWGAMVTLKHSIANTFFYSIYGHLNKNIVKTFKINTILKRGDFLAEVGNFKINFNGFSHFHIQLLTEYAYNNLEIREKGYFSYNISTIAEHLFPNPILFIVGNDDSGLKLAEDYIKKNTKIATQSFFQ